VKSPMVVIPPPENPIAEDACALKLIRRLGKTLGCRSNHRMLDNQITKGDKSVRRIQTGRYEIFVNNAADKGSGCFDKILRRNRFAEDTKDVLIKYATRRALKDGRLGGSSYKFGNFSMIVTFENVHKQAPHIDLLTPNSQFGLLFTDDSPGTLVYLVDEHIQTVEDLEKLWNEWGDSGTQMPTNLITAFRQSKEVMLLVKDFGDVLVPEERMKEVKIEGPLSAGSVLSLPGNVIHAGPEALNVREVMFFSGCPDESKVEEYHPDTQYTGFFLCGQFAILLWRHPTMGFKERLYLLRMLMKYMHQSKVRRKWAHHFPLGGFCTFLSTVESESLSPDALEALLQTAAKNESLCFFNVTGDFEVVSADNLQTKWDGEVFKIEVYRRLLDGKILVKYLNDNTDVGFSSWEGSKPGDTYRLEMNVKDAKFNGVNGKLLDTDGDDIKCFCKSTRQRGAKNEPSDETRETKKRRKK